MGTFKSLRYTILVPQLGQSLIFFLKHVFLKQILIQSWPILGCNETISHIEVYFSPSFLKMKTFTT